MVPFVLALGLLAGALVPPRLAWLAVPVLAVAWATIVGLVGACTGDCLPSAALIAAVNAAAGVAIALAVRMALAGWRST